MTICTMQENNSIIRIMQYSFFPRKKKINARLKKTVVVAASIYIL